jgi:hypothetical protein
MSELSKSKKSTPAHLFKAIFFLRLKSLVRLATGKRKRIRFTKDPKKLAQDLDKFSALLFSLSRKDKSRDPSFLEALSITWNSIMQNCESLLDAHPEDFSDEMKMKDLILLIKNHPKEALHNTGYYLSEGAGIEWAPVPFMDILRQLHEEQQINFNNSQLSIWIERISSIRDGLAN